MKVSVIHNIPLARCMYNNYYRYLINYKTNPKLIPDFVYKMILNKFEKPTNNEHIDKIETVKGCVPLDIKYFYYYY